MAVSTGTVIGVVAPIVPNSRGETARLAAHADADFERKRALLELLVDCVIVTDSVVEIRYVVPAGPDGGREPFWRSRTDCRGGDLPLQTGDRGRAPARTDRRQATELAIAVRALNRMLELGRPESVRIA